MLQLNGCSADCAALHQAKDLAENKRGARVLVVCVELTITTFRGPHEGDTFGTLIPQALFGDSACAVVVGADAMHPVERPLFEMVSASQALIPGSEKHLNVRLGEGGVDIDISFNLPGSSPKISSTASLMHVGHSPLIALTGSGTTSSGQSIRAAVGFWTVSCWLAGWSPGSWRRAEQW
jgi:hypothetical protein